MIVGVVVTSSTTFLIDFGPGGRTCDANLVRNVSTIGSIVGRTGAMLLVLGLFAAGAASRDLHYNVRAFLFLGGAISLIFASLIFPSFGGFSPFSC